MRWRPGRFSALPSQWDRRGCRKEIPPCPRRSGNRNHFQPDARRYRRQHNRGNSGHAAKFLRSSNSELSVGCPEHEYSVRQQLCPRQRRRRAKHVARLVRSNRLKLQAGTDANERLQSGFAESHAAAVKHAVIAIEKTIGRIKRYLQLTTVMAAKQRARAHTVTRMTAKVSAGRPPSCHANTAANR